MHVRSFSVPFYRNVAASALFISDQLLAVGASLSGDRSAPFSLTEKIENRSILRSVNTGGTQRVVPIRCVLSTEMPENSLLYLSCH